MFAKSRVFGVCVAAVAPLVVGCSNGGGKQSAPTISSATTATAGSETSVVNPGSFGGPVGPTGIARTLGACSKHEPTNSSGELLTRLNSGIHGLDQQLVPIEVFAVRICAYVEGPQAPRTPLVASGVLIAPAAQLLGNDTNRLPKNPYTQCGPSPTQDDFVVTFASSSQRVEVLAIGGCGGDVTNGRFHAEPVLKWFNKLQRYTSRVDPRLGTTGPQG